jgi:hypothetical protein
MVDPTNQTYHFTYDHEHRLTLATPPSPAGPVHASFDPVGNRTSVTDGNGQWADPISLDIPDESG